MMVEVDIVNMGLFHKLISELSAGLISLQQDFSKNFKKGIWNS